LLDDSIFTLVIERIKKYQLYIQWCMASLHPIANCTHMMYSNIT
jgi:hypothetical protein